MDHLEVPEDGFTVVTHKSHRRSRSASSQGSTTEDPVTGQSCNTGSGVPSSPGSGRSSRNVSPRPPTVFRLGEQLPPGTYDHRFRPVQAGRFACVLAGCTEKVGDTQVSFIHPVTHRRDAFQPECMKKLLAAVGRSTELTEFNLNPEWGEEVAKILSDASRSSKLGWSDATPWDSRRFGEREDFEYHQCAEPDCRKVLKQNDSVTRAQVTEDGRWKGFWIFLHDNCSHGHRQSDPSTVAFHH